MINVCKFYEVYCEVEPKRRALNEANQMLQDAQTRLSNLVAKVAKLEETLADLTRRYTVAVEAKVKCQQDADATGATISLANRLVGGLASEKVRQILRSPTRYAMYTVQVRWGTSVKQLKEQADMMPGDVLLVSSFISYVGCFTKQYRVRSLLF